MVELPRFTGAFVLALLLVLFVRLLLGALARPLDLFRGPTRSTDYLHMEQVVLQQRPAPRVLLMGSSCMLYGPHEDDFAELSGLEPEDVANVGVIGADAHESLWLLQRNPRALERLELVVFDLNPLMLRRTELRPRFFRLMTLTDRLRLDGLPTRSEALADWVLRHRADKRSLEDWLRSIARLVLGKDPLGFYWVRELWTEEDARARAGRDFSGPNTARKYLGAYELSHSALDATDRLLAFCRERGIPIVFLVTPNSASFMQAVEALPHGAEILRDWRQWTERLASQAPVIRRETAESVGLGESAFMDAVHLDRESGRNLTRALVDELAACKLLPDPSHARAAGRSER